MKYPVVKTILNKIYTSRVPDPGDLEFVLSLRDPEEIREVFTFADKIREKFCGKGIALRGIIEFSNYCFRRCFYCGINKDNSKIKRYRMSRKEILDTVGRLVSCRIKTVVLQSGEDAGIDAAWLEDVILSIKSRFDIAVTLSVGERENEDYRLWRRAGAERYLLKIETSNEKLYSSMHPGMDFRHRIGCLNALKSLGYQTGSGIIVGLPGQDLKTIARDILFFKKRDFDMIGIGPFIPHQNTCFTDKPGGDAGLALKTLALTRIVTRNAHLPATTALGSLDRDYRPEGLACGANVLMPNFTPLPYRKLYEIYPQKRCVSEAPGACGTCMEKMAKGLGRFIDYSRADSLKKRDQFTAHS
ncbi:MAG: [FeFe] hydrogenase H-cluster radical SAM maturase HydE [Candidatus Omnitrophica bacterium]|nr:[FeFe] hydrogenase H-cluster radical SAM maturase HydE [Candidatus Omnitrophota bacterium]